MTYIMIIHIKFVLISGNCVGLVIMHFHHKSIGLFTFDDIVDIIRAFLKKLPDNLRIINISTVLI